MNNNLKIFLVVLIVFLVSTTILYLFNNYYLSKTDFEKKYLNLLSSLEPESEKVYLMGNSRMGVFDKKYIQNYLKDEGFSHKVYFLANPATQPEDRLILLDKIISSKPNLVIFGIDITDFRSPQNELFEKHESFVLDPQVYLTDLGTNIFPPHYFYDFKNPKLSSLGIIKMVFQEKPINANKNRQLVLTHEELKELADAEKYNQIFRPENNKQLDAIKQINNKLSENNIKFILVLMPRSQEFIDIIPEKEKEKFFNSIDDLERIDHIKSHSLFNKYADLAVFQDLNHVTKNVKGQIFSEDIAKIISMEIQS